VAAPLIPPGKTYRGPLPACFLGASVFPSQQLFGRNGVYSSYWILGIGALVGGGVENNLNIFGISAPGWFMKTEYRSAFYDRKAITELFDVTNLPVGRDITFKPWTQTISTSLVYRFNWSGSVAAKY
jgi:hypothetical protein